MSRFCVQTITLDPLLRPVDGVLRAAVLGPAGEAASVADQIVARAHEQARRIVEQARADAGAQVEAAQAQVLREAQLLMGAMQARYRAFVDDCQPLVIDLTQQMFARLVGGLTPRKRMEAMFRRLQEEAPARLLEPVLWIHPSEAALVPATEWEIRTDPELAPGMCRLEALDGQWSIDFPAAIEAVRQVLGAAPPPADV